MQDAPSVWPALAAFAAVIALIPIALWILKRLQSGSAGSTRSITMRGGLTLGPRERIAIIETQGRRWMIGVTGQSISMLAELDASQSSDGKPDNKGNAAGGDSLTAALPGQAAFSDLLDRFKKRG
jgi:flagellar protein FliO/FliZ